MPPDQLDRDDMGILHLLQNDARNVTTTEIGEQIGLSSSSVATRINALENEGIITGYGPFIDYEAAGFDTHVLIRATVPVEDRTSIVEDAIKIPNVISVKELVTDEGNMLVELVSSAQEEVEHVSEELTELGIEILDTEILKMEYNRVFNHFGERYTDQ